MRFFGQQFRREPSSAIGIAPGSRRKHGRDAAYASGVLLPVFAAALLARPGVAQTAPYVLPYTMSTYAGPHAAYTPGAPCATNGKLVALNASGDGCPAASVSVGSDPHDIRVDARGNVFYIDNTSTVLIHKISPQTGQQTVYTGNRICSNYTDTYGDGCPANDSAANNNTAVMPTSDKLKAQRGLSIAPNGDLYSAGYNDYEIHRISAATGVMTLVAGTGTSNTTSFTGPNALTTGLGSTRGVGVDAAGNIFIADTANNILQEVPASGSQAGQLIALTAPNAAGTKTVTTAQPAGTALLNAPEDVQVDSNGNIYIADYGNNVVRAIYSGKGTLPGISNPVAGYMYTVAGGVVIATGAANTTYPSDGSAPTVLATNLALTVRKLSLDSLGNLYIADSSNNVVWFVDNTTGYARTIAGRFGQTASTTPAFVCNPSASAVGDGCPGTSASLFSASDMGVSPDNQGNLYITDAQGANVALSRIRKQLSGLNFPSTSVAAPLTQTLLIHFAVGDTPAAASAFVSNNAAFAVGAVTCTATTGANADGTDDCLVPVTFNPTVAGYQTATLSIASAKGGTSSYLLTGTGTGASLAVDPGYLTAFNSSVSNAQGVTSDLAGNLYIVDTGHNQVLRYNAATGTTSTFAGTGTAGFSGDNGQAAAATLKAPTAVAVDLAGNVYITDTGNNVIRRVTTGGLISTYAGGGTACAATANACPATQTSFNAPTGIATDNAGQVYVADSGNNLIRQVSNTGFVYALAGGSSPSACSTDAKVTPHSTDAQNDGCPALQGIFSSPNGLAYDPVGNFLLVADTGNNIVRSVYLANAITVTNTSVGTAVINPLALIAGNGQAGTSISSSGAAGSQLNAPRGVAVDAAEDVLIADTGNSAIRFVNNANGTISTIAGVLGTSGAGTVPSAATSTLLSSPAAVAISGGNNLYIADSGNNRILADNRSQITYDFGRVNQGTSSPTAVFTETNTGSVSGTLPSPLYVRSGSADFTLTSSTGPGCSAGGSLSVGASCLLNGVFSPSGTGSESAAFSENNALPFNSPSLTFIGLGAVLTKTTSTLAQTVPASGNPQFGGSFTLTATVTAQACNTTGAPACFPTGTVTFSVDGATFGAPVPLTGPASNTVTSATASQVISGLSTGIHTAACAYSGDDFYGASSCGNFTLTVAQASTTSVLTAATNGKSQFPNVGCFVIPSGNLKNDTQCIGQTLTATVTSNTSGIPTGTVTFYNGTITLGTASLGSNGAVSLSLIYIIDTNGRLVSDTSLPAGSYNLSCTYSGAPNFAASNCAAIPFTVLPQTPAFTLTPRGCALANLYLGQEQAPCSNGTASTIGNGDTLMNGYPVVATADGATTDATIFINPTNTLSGAITIGCSGLPQYSICTFSPSVSSLSAGTSYAAPFPIDVTLWTDIRPGNATSALRRPDFGSSHDETGGALLAMLLGWPVTLFGLAGVIRSRRRGSRVLPWLAALLVMAGSVTAMTGCGLGGPGVDKVVLTPAGTYPITMTVSVGGVTQTTTVYFKVGSPGITGQQ